MRTKSIILIFIALACGLVASIGISQVLDNSKGNNAPQVEMTPILVAMADIDIGGKLDANNVKLEEWPKSKIPETALTSLDSLDDRYARVRLFKGEALLESKLMGSNEGIDIAPKIPAGFRAVPLKVEQDTVIGLIQPGDKVDVMVIVRRSDEIDFTGTVTILTDVRVFSVGQDVERTVDKEGKQMDVKTVSLLVKQDQAEKLTMAAEIGKIRMTLRRPDEVDDELSDGKTTLQQIFGFGKQETSAGANAEPEEKTESIVDIFTQPVATVPTETASAGTFGKFRMQVMTPTEVKRFEWQDRDELPVELPPPGDSAGSSSSSAASVPQLPILDTPAPAPTPVGSELPTESNQFRGR